jgi:hypothetical protein
VSCFAVALSLGVAHFSACQADVGNTWSWTRQATFVGDECVERSETFCARFVFFFKKKKKNKQTNKQKKNKFLFRPVQMGRNV